MNCERNILVSAEQAISFEGLIPTPTFPNRITARTLTELYRLAAERFSSRTAFAQRKKDGTYAPTTFAELYERGLCLATALIELGVKARDHVGLLSDNRIEWITADYGVLLAGAADVPRGSDVTAQEIAYILSHADCAVTFVENISVLEKVRQVRDEIPQLHTVILMDPQAEAPEGVLRMEDLIKRGKELRSAGNREAEARAEAVQPEDLFTLIYTSGTTGKPKGVQLTHANMCSQLRNLPFGLSENDRGLSILPVWHSYERVFTMVTISNGCATYYTTLRTIADDLKSVRPTVMASAPRLWESLYERIMDRVKSAPPVRKALFRIAYGSARRVKRARRFFMGQQLDTHGRNILESLLLAVGHAVGALVSLPFYLLLDRIVLAKLRAIVGGNFRGTISGGGALPPHIDEFFNFIGIPVLEGYGLTETSPVLAVRTWDNLVIGTVGPIYPETEIRIVDLSTGEILFPNPKYRREGRGLKGEIHARGPQVMRGYYKDPEGTTKVLKDGWLDTGDIGMVTFNDCLKILGRSKETIVLRSGENVEPVPVESKLCESPYISQCMVVGQDQKHLGVLVVPNVEQFQATGLNVADAAAVRDNPRAQEILHAEIRRLVSAENGFKPFERISHCNVITKPFEVGDELTNTYKLRRHVMYEKYASVIEEMYSEKH